MKKVEFVHIKSELSGYGPMKGKKCTFEGAEEAIRARLEDGWDFCGYIPLDTRGVGDVETISLIFQRDP